LIKERLEAEELKQVEYEEDEENLSSSYDSSCDSDDPSSDEAPFSLNANAQEYRRDRQA
jgi:hypothetical protein